MMPPMKSLLYILLFLLISSSTPESFLWTRFRGSDGQGIDLNGSVQVKWDSSDLRWKIPLPGKGNASPVVWANKIFVTSADDEKDLGYVMAVDHRDGKIFEKRYGMGFKTGYPRYDRVTSIL